MVSIKATLTASLAVLVLSGRPARADAPLSCVVTVATPSKGTAKLVAKFDFDSMAGVVTIDNGSSVRRIRVKSVPSAATYLLMFAGYDAGDQKPAAEKLTKDSVVARLVAFGDTNHLFFDSDLHVALPASLDGFLCK